MKEKRPEDMCTLTEWSGVWGDEVLPSVVKESTRYMYAETMRRHVLPTLGDTPLDELTEDMVEDWVQRLREEQVPGTVEGRMTDGTVRNTLSVLSGCLRDAQKHGLIGSNPCLKAAWKHPGVNICERRAWLTGEQLQVLEPLLLPYRLKDGSPAGTAYLLSIYAGLGFSEASALRWEDVDLKGKELHLRYFLSRQRTDAGNGRQLFEYRQEELFGRKKRTVPISGRVAKYLSELAENDGRAEAFVLCAPGRRQPVDPDILRTHLMRRSKAAGFDGVTPRMLRDTYAIRLLQAGASSDTVAELLGLTSARQIIRRYMPEKETDRRELVERLELL